MEIATPFESESLPPPPETLPVEQVAVTVTEDPGDVGPVNELLESVNVRGAPWAPCAP